MIQDIWVLLSSKIADTWRPDKHCHDISGTDPAFVLLTCEDAPLARTWHEVFVTKMPLNYASLISLAFCHLLYLINTHRLHDIAELDARSDITPLLLVLLWSLKLNRALSMNFHEASF